MAAAALQPAPQPLAPAQSPVPTPRQPPPQGPANDPGTEAVTVEGTKPKPFSEGELSNRLSETDEKLAAINKQTGALQPPKLELPKPPEPKQTNPVEAWGSSAMLLAGIGSLMTRAPLTTALNAAAGVMSAMHKNDMEQAQLQFDQWKISNEQAIKTQQFQMEAYKTALEKGKTDQQQAIAEVNAYSAAFGHVQVAEAAKARNLTQVQRILLDEQRLAEKQAVDGQKIVEAFYFKKALNSPEFQKKLAAAKDDQERGQMVLELASGADPDDVKFQAKRLNAGDQSVLQYAGRGQQGAAYVAAIRHEARLLAEQDGQTPADLAAQAAAYQGVRAAYRTLGTTSARIELGVAELKRLEPQVLAASDELKRSNYPSLNAAIQAGQHETGNKALKNLAVRLQGLKSAFSQVLTRGGVPTDSARATTDELFNARDPDGVMQSALFAMNDEASAIEEAPADVGKLLNKRLGGTAEPAGSLNKPAEPPAAGTIKMGFRFKGGDPAKQENWEKL